MMTIQWTRKAYKQLHKIGDSKARIGVYNAVDKLRDWPDVKNVKALQGRSDYRLRVGRYRVIFDVRQSLRVIEIQEVRKRDERTY